MSAASPLAPPSAARALIDRVERVRRERPKEALESLRRDFARAARSASPAERGELWRLRGHVLRGLRQAGAAAGAYRRAEHCYAEARDTREQGRCAIGWVDALLYLGRYGEAMRVARRGEIHFGLLEQHFRVEHLTFEDTSELDDILLLEISRDAREVSRPAV